MASSENSTRDLAPRTHLIGEVATDGEYDANRARQLSSQILMRETAGSRYIVRGELARGGMGVIHTVFDQDLSRQSAMKVISVKIIEDEKRLRAFIEEARVTAQLEHPNIIPVHEIGMIEQSGCPYYTMKLIEGEALLDVITKLASGNKDYIQKYARHRLLDTFRKVCDAVAYAHSRGVIHRDIKPENIMVGQFGEVILMDWGLAKYIGDEEETIDPTEAIEQNMGRRTESVQNFMRTEDGMIKGSLAYLSPEQAYGEMSEIDHQTDIFLLGATLYHMFTHLPPYSAESVGEIIQKAEKCDFLPPSECNPRAQIPQALERIIIRAMSPLKRNRYPSVTQLIDDIDAFIGGRRSSGRRIFATGQNLIEYGEQSMDTYVIINGRVQVNRVLDGREIPIATLGRGEIVGEMAGISHNSRSATVMALETTETLVITHDLLLEELEKLPPWMEKIVFSLADRVRILDQNVHPLLLKNRTFPVVNQLNYIFSVAQMQMRDPNQIASYRRDPLVDEIALTLGIDRESTNKVIDIVIRFGMLEMDKDSQRVTVPQLDQLHTFVDYCRYQFNIRGGLKQIDELRLSPETHSFFRQMHRELRKLQETDPVVALAEQSRADHIAASK